MIGFHGMTNGGGGNNSKNEEAEIESNGNSQSFKSGSVRTMLNSFYFWFGLFHPYIM